ncbi:MAG: NUDIX hydrolase [Acidimicrobiales bacterium]|nr:NUDIX hydrolase [Acidimicrobiales bacterium]
MSFRRLGEEPRYRGELVSLGAVSVEGPDGGRFEREVVHHPGAVCVVPVSDGGRVALCVRQYRAAADRVLLEVPAGKRDVDGEPPEATAHRELEEEVGMRAGRMVKLGEFYNSPGFCDEYSHLFLATDLSPGARSPQGAEEQHLELAEVELSSVELLVAEGAIVDAKTIIGLCLARARLIATG